MSNISTFHWHRIFSLGSLLFTFNCKKNFFFPCNNSLVFFRPFLVWENEYTYHASASSFNNRETFEFPILWTSYVFWLLFYESRDYFFVEKKCEHRRPRLMDVFCGFGFRWKIFFKFIIMHKNGCRNEKNQMRNSW